MQSTTSINARQLVSLAKQYWLAISCAVTILSGLLVAGIDPAGPRRSAASPIDHAEFIETLRELKAFDPQEHVELLSVAPPEAGADGRMYSTVIVRSRGRYGTAWTNWECEAEYLKKQRRWHVILVSCGDDYRYGDGAMQRAARQLNKMRQQLEDDRQRRRSPPI